MPQQTNQDQRSFLARLIAGGAAGPRGDPFANEKSMFAQRPAASVPVPIPRPDPGQSAASTATSPSSLIRSPAAAAPAPIAANATSPSSLMQTPPGAGPGPIPLDMFSNPNDANMAMPKRPFSPSPVMAGLLGRPSPKKATAAAQAAAAAPAAPAPFSVLHPSTWLGGS
jgi:hypothetical protein